MCPKPTLFTSSRELPQKCMLQMKKKKTIETYKGRTGGPIKTPKDSKEKPSSNPKREGDQINSHAAKKPKYDSKKNKTWHG